MMRGTQPQDDSIMCEQCLEPFPETQIVITDEGIAVCRNCYRDLRRPDGRRDKGVRSAEL
jgi:formylmethanofuran dehydrogenase subunit E